MTKILYIEDEQPILEEVLEWLTFEGYEAVGAANGRLGLEIGLHEQPDLIICDIMMPEMDGYSVLWEIRSNPATASTPFIFLTAASGYENLRKGMDLGADDYVTKPFDRSTLLQAIHTRLQKKALQESQAQQQIEFLSNLLDSEREQRLLKSRLVAMFSHDFRNALVAILFSNSLLKDHSDRLTPERQAIQLNRIEGSVRQLLQMLDDMLVVAEMESGQLNFSPQATDLNSLTKSIVEEFQFIANETHQLRFESNCHTTLKVDPKLFRQIASNLLSNAIKYSAAGTEICVTLVLDHEYVALGVRDAGIGISEEDQARLFKPFQRSAEVHHIQGTGLGLAIVKQAVDLHGGSVEVVSQLGRGSVFTARLPVAIDQD